MSSMVLKKPYNPTDKNPLNVYGKANRTEGFNNKNFKIKSIYNFKLIG